jgi:hypothetical protein
MFRPCIQPSSDTAFKLHEENDYCKVKLYKLKSDLLLYKILPHLKHGSVEARRFQLNDTSKQWYLILNLKFEIQINQPTRCNSFSSLLLDVYVQLNMIRASSRQSSGFQQLQLQPLVLPLERGGSSAATTTFQR